ncbi:hypothetical protein J1N35_040388 [Gossypium stocksii]|uniref:Reverse transcriptase domain-containing protein n=1 Tax=Gossypium stocksii TaxID=47602 RepID=A0A9D3UDT9_9ROSI|nr:hypothetical protein J1N35_040388 [Gossypium stocksii]
MNVIANCFKIIFPKIIAQEQIGFITGRNIIDNIIIAQEMIHSMKNCKSRKWMAIKIDLKKSYDRVRWDFINISLQAAGIPSYLSNVIISDISNSTMQVLWNGVPMAKFRPVRGSRQVSKGIWKPIRLSRSGPNLSHLFFADVLVIFCKADEQHGKILKEILNEFCELSYHKVNPRKTNIFFSKGVKESMVDLLSNLLSFHKKVTNSTFHFVIEKVRTKLQSWDARQLSFAGRVTLVQSVFLAIPIGWNSICQPKWCGGLGMRQLRDQNIVFLLNLGYKLVSDDEALWVRVIRTTYGMNEPLLVSIAKVWLPEEIISHIMRIPPLHPAEEPDRLSWQHTSTRGFSIRSAYKLLKEDSWNLRDELWKTKNRNLSIFQRKSWSSSEVIKVSICWAKYASLDFRNGLSDNIDPLHGESITNDLIFLNTDGVVLRTSRRAVAGGVVRDSNGNWVMGYNCFLGNCSIFDAELWGILDGLKLIQRRGRNNVIIHFDSLEVVKAIHENISKSSTSALNRRIHWILSQES